MEVYGGQGEQIEEEREVVRFGGVVKGGREVVVLKVRITTGNY
jgi:hypothetical protein